MRITIVTYHYVRNAMETNYAKLNALCLDRFKFQLEYMRDFYTFISPQDLINAINNPEYNLPPRSALLTFDDGYSDHYDNVLPIFRKLGLKGAFFPPVRPALEGKVLDVNKIHFVLASEKSLDWLISVIESMVRDNREEFNLDSFENYRKKWAIPSRWDCAETVFFKRMLQKGLPLKLRSQIIDYIFSKVVTNDEKDFSSKIYMSTSQLEDMIDAGMYIGSHGFSHNWLNTLTYKQQELEVDKSLKFLSSLGANTKDWIMCYPYGGYDDSLLKLIKSKGCVAGLSLKIGICDLQFDNHLILPRIDTNDLPQVRGHKMNRWIQEAMH